MIQENYITDILKVNLTKKIYTLDELKQIIYPILKKYGIKEAYIFGSYSRGTANENSDVDIMIRNNNFSLFDISDIEAELIIALQKNIDLAMIGAYEDDELEIGDQNFYEIVKKERKNIYEL